MPVQELSGSTAIVTGASRGFGRATALALAARGAHVVGVARSEVPLKELETELGGSFTSEVADVTDPSLPARLYSLYAPRTVVLAAGAGPATSPLHQQTWQGFSRNWDVDVQQVFNFLRQALNGPLGAGGVVVSMSSGAAMRGSPLSGGYAGAKATIKFLSSYAASEAQRNSLDVRFVSVLPQLTPATDLGRTAVEAYAARAGLTVDAYLQQVGPTLTLDQVAQSMVDLATDDTYVAPAYLLTVEGLKALE
jgi:NAD(P)-dependent dehydrogenase (short-subunit alcohol dehydrogenase family)